jgi:hypothetical protein
MVNGPEVFSMYNVIVDQRYKELKKANPTKTVSELGELIRPFINSLREGSLSDLTEMYELYK